MNTIYIYIWFVEAIHFRSFSIDQSYSCWECKSAHLVALKCISIYLLPPSVQKVMTFLTGQIRGLKK